MQKTIILTIMTILLSLSALSYTSCDTDWQINIPCDELVYLYYNCSTYDAYYSNGTIAQADQSMIYKGGTYIYNYTLNFTEPDIYTIEFCDNITSTIINIENTTSEIDNFNFSSVGYETPNYRNYAFTITAEVNNTADTVLNVTANITNPDGNTTFENFTLSSTSGNITTWTLSYTPLSTGTYTFRLNATDDDTTISYSAFNVEVTEAPAVSSGTGGAPSGFIDVDDDEEEDQPIEYNISIELDNYFIRPDGTIRADIATTVDNQPYNKDFQIKITDSEGLVIFSRQFNTQNGSYEFFLDARGYLPEPPYPYYEIQQGTYNMTAYYFRGTTKIQTSEEFQIRSDALTGKAIDTAVKEAKWYYWVILLGLIFAVLFLIFWFFTRGDKNQKNNN